MGPWCLGPDQANYHLNLIFKAIQFIWVDYSSVVTINLVLVLNSSLQELLSPGLECGCSGWVHI